jgi:hypothetical protein
MCGEMIDIRVVMVEAVVKMQEEYAYVTLMCKRLHVVRYFEKEW